MPATVKDYPPPSISNGDLPVALGAGGSMRVVIFAGGNDDDDGGGGELAVRLVGFCAVLFARIVGGETGEAVLGSDAATVG